jgi:hypothetical protein
LVPVVVEVTPDATKIAAAKIAGDNFNNLLACPESHATA